MSNTKMTTFLMLFDKITTPVFFFHTGQSCMGAHDRPVQFADPEIIELLAGIETGMLDIEQDIFFFHLLQQLKSMLRKTIASRVEWCGFEYLYAISMVAELIVLEMGNIQGEDTVGAGECFEIIPEIGEDLRFGAVLLRPKK